MSLEYHLGRKAFYEELPTYEEAKAILYRVVDKLSMGEAISVLKTFEVEKLSKLDKKYYGLFIDRCRRVLGDKT